FQRASPSSVRRRLAASLVLEFTGTSRAVADRTGAAIVVCASASLVFDRLQHLLRKRQIESSRRPKRFAKTVPCLVAIEFSQLLGVVGSGAALLLEQVAPVVDHKHEYQPRQNRTIAVPGRTVDVPGLRQRTESLILDSPATPIDAPHLHSIPPRRKAGDVIG